MTSNIAPPESPTREAALASLVTAAQGEEKHIKDAVMGELKRTFRPEFLNRVDDIIIFHQLTKAGDSGNRVQNACPGFSSNAGEGDYADL